MLTDSVVHVDTVRLLSTSLLLGLIVASAACGVGIPIALAISRTNIPGGVWFVRLFTVQLFTPVYLQAAAWKAAFTKLVGFLEYLGVEGVSSNSWLAAIWIHSVAAIPWAVLIVSAGLRSVERELEEFALLHGPVWRVLLFVTLEKAWPFVLAAYLWVILSVFTDMTVTDLLNIRTYAEQVYLMYALGDESWLTNVEGLVGGITVAVGVAITLRAMATTSPASSLSSWRSQKVFDLGPLRWLALFLTGFVAIGTLGFPLFSLIHELGLEARSATESTNFARTPQRRVDVNNGGSLTSDGSSAAAPVPLRGRTWTMRHALKILSTVTSESRTEFRTSFLLGSLSASCVVIGAAWLAWIARRGRAWGLPAMLAIAFGLAIPGPVLGSFLAYLFSLSQWDVIAYLYDRTLFAPCLALIVRSWPLAGIILLAAFQHPPQDQLEMAQLDGAGRLGQFWFVVVPQCARAIGTAWVAAFTISFGDLAASVLVTPPGVHTVPLRVFGLLHSGVTDKVAALCLITLAVCTALSILSARVSARLSSSSN